MTLLRIQHADDLTTMPDHWFIWREMLPPRTRKVYEQLRKSEYAEAEYPVSISNFAKQLGFKPTAVLIALNELEQQDFLSLFEDEGTLEISVALPPPVSSAVEQANSTIGAKAEETVKARSRRVLAEWKIQFEKFTSREWKPWVGDEVLAFRLCQHEPNIGQLLSMIRFYWLYMHDGEGATLATFRREYDAIASRMRDMED